MTLSYQSGFGNTFSTEALKGALPVGQNSPQRAPQGLYAEVLSGTSFTAPRADNLSSWLYRQRPSAMHAPYKRIDNGLLRSGPFGEAETPPRGPAANSRRAGRLHRRALHRRRLRRSGLAGGARGARLPRQPLDGE